MKMGILAASIRRALSPPVPSDKEYATLNPADTSSNLTLGDGNLSATRNSGAAWATSRATQGKNSGKWYFEVKNTVDGAPNGGYLMIGLSRITTSVNSQIAPPGVTDEFGYQANTSPQNLYQNSGFTSVSYALLDEGQTAGVAIDYDAGKAWIRSTGGSGWARGGDPVAGTTPTFTFTPGLTLFPAVGLYGSPQSASVNFGATAFDQDVPSGFNAGYYRLPISKLDGTSFEDLIDEVDWTVNGGVSVVSGKLNFDGSGYLIRSIAPVTIASGKPYKFSAKINPSSLSGFATIFNANTSGGGSAPGISIYRDGNYITCNDGSSGGTGPDFGVIVSGVESLLELVCDGATTKSYVNGELRNTYGAITGNGRTLNALMLGRYGGSPGGTYWNGTIDDFSFSIDS